MVIRYQHTGRKLQNPTLWQQRFEGQLKSSWSLYMPDIESVLVRTLELPGPDGHVATACALKIMLRSGEQIHVKVAAEDLAASAKQSLERGRKAIQSRLYLELQPNELNTQLAQRQLRGSPLGWL